MSDTNDSIRRLARFIDARQGQALASTAATLSAEATREAERAAAEILSDVTPQPIGTADPGDALLASRDDHIHGIPNPLPVESILFDTTPTVTPVEGLLFWNDDDKTLELGMAGGNVALQIGQEQILRVLNDSGGTLSNGAVVYVSGGTGNTPKVKLAKADAEVTSATTLGVMTEEVATNQHGYMTTIGLVRGLNTNAYTVGTVLYLSPSTAGGLTSTKPSAPNHMVTVATVIRQSSTEGVILVSIQNGYELGELHDVSNATPTDGQVLRWDNANGYWEPDTLDAADVSAVPTAGGTTSYLNVGSATGATTGQVKASADLFANSDTEGLFTRVINNNFIPTDHFTATSLDASWLWAGTPFGDAADTIDLTSFPSVLRLINVSTTEDLFMYKSGGTAIARVFVGTDSYIGVRVDDGTTSNAIEIRIQADGNGANTVSTLRTTGGVLTTVTHQTAIMAQWLLLRATRTSTFVFTYLSPSTPRIPVVSQAGSITWTASRAGLTFGQRVATGVDRAGYVDWIQIDA